MMFPFNNSSRLRSELAKMRGEIDSLKILTARPLIQNIRNGKLPVSLHEVEFKVFSQFGDDGIIQFLIHRLAPLPDSFVEFGVENYRESNTRFLLLNNNWSGLVMDGNQKSVRQIQTNDIYWRHTLTAKRAWITRDNVNDLIRDAGFSGKIGLLSIDLDGNDYWVWQKLDIVDPVITIVEYNSVFGPDLAVTVPYDENFVRHRAHYSGQLWGASLSALNLLAKQKGCALVGCNSAGNNAYFVRNDKIDNLPTLDVHEAFVDARWRDSRDQQGNLNYLTGPARLQSIADMEVYNLRQNKLARLSALQSSKT